MSYRSSVPPRGTSAKYEGAAAFGERFGLALFGGVLLAGSLGYYVLEPGATVAAALETTTLAALSLSVASLGVGVGRESAPDVPSTAIVRTSLAGCVVAFLLVGWIMLVLRVRGLVPSDPSFVSLSAVAIGANVGCVLGIYRHRLRRRTDALLTRTDRLEEVAGTVGHDLRNPLNIAQGHLQLARETGEGRHFEAVEDAHARMERLITEIHAMNPDVRGDALDDVGAVETLDLRTCAERVWADARTGDATLSVRTERPVATHRRRLELLLHNLFRNAVEHAGEAPRVVVGESDDGFYVADDGPGIPPEHRERVWEGGFSTEPGSAGFGLTIARRIAEAAGWGMTIAESSDGGARIEFDDVARDPTDDGRSDRFVLFR